MLKVTREAIEKVVESEYQHYRRLGIIFPKHEIRERVIRVAKKLEIKNNGGRV